MNNIGNNNINNIINKFCIDNNKQNHFLYKIH